MSIKTQNPLIVIFGRPNVGKSTLFNCLTEKKQALISKQAGTTRDSNTGQVLWRGKEFDLVDTGGIIDISNLIQKKKKTEEIDDLVQKKVKNYLKEADIILFLVDAKAGLLEDDKNLAIFLKKRYSEEKIILVGNKAEKASERSDLAEFNKLSLNEPAPLSAATGSGTGDLLDLIFKKLKKEKKFGRKKAKEDEKEKIMACIIGKPNAGKSSLLNKILGYEKVIVSPVAHTTREPQNTKIEFGGKEIELIDTAGITRKASKSRGLEKFGIQKSLAALKKADIALLVIDISDGISQQDKKIIDEIMARKVSFMIIANKWDLIKEKNVKEHTQYIYSHFPFATWAPIHFTSAKTGSKVDKILDLILEMAEKRKIEINQNTLDKLLSKIVKIHKPAKGKGYKRPHIYKIKQTGTNPPRFIVNLASDDTLHFSYVRFIENQIRKKFDIIGAPIDIQTQNARKVHGRKG